jgi:hypothetical protein
MRFSSCHASRSSMSSAYPNIPRAKAARERVGLTPNISQVPTSPRQQPQSQGAAGSLSAGSPVVGASTCRLFASACSSAQQQQKQSTSLDYQIYRNISLSRKLPLPGRWASRNRVFVSPHS